MACMRQVITLDVQKYKTRAYGEVVALHVECTDGMKERTGSEAAANIFRPICIPRLMFWFGEENFDS